MKTCLSCNQVLSETDAYCQGCGQKVHLNVKTLYSIVQDFISNFLNFDNQLFQSLYHLFYPARLTKKYFEGIRKPFLTPIRLFFLSLIVLYGLNASLGDAGDAFNTHKKMHKLMMAADLRNNLDKMQDDAAYAECNSNLDTIRRNLLKRYKDIRCQHFDPLHNNNSVDFSFFSKQILAIDAITLPSEELVRKYDVQEWHVKFLLKQSLRLYKNSNAVLSFIINNSLWGFVVLSLIMALFLKVLYIRRNYYFVEHLVWMIHLNTFYFIVSSIFSIIAKFIDDHNPIKGFIIAAYIIGMLVYSWIAIRNYYQQGWFKTTTKFFLFLLGYLFVALLILIMILIISALIF